MLSLLSPPSPLLPQPKKKNLSLVCCYYSVAKLYLTLIPWTIALQASSSVHGISEAKILEWVAIAYS